MIICILSEKGGTGKSTIATNLAVIRAIEGKDVLLIDADPQNSSRAFADSREEKKIKPTFTCMEIIGKNIDAEIERLAPKFDDIIVDVAGMYSSTMRSILGVSNIAIVPFKTSKFEKKGVYRMEDILKLDANRNLRVVPVLNMANPNPKVADKSKVIEAFSVLTHMKPPFLYLRDLVAFERAPDDGMSVVEMDKKKAENSIMDIMKLYEEVFKNG